MEFSIMYIINEVNWGFSELKMVDYVEFMIFLVLNE